MNKTITVWVLYRSKTDGFGNNHIKFHSLYGSEELALAAKNLIQPMDWEKDWTVKEEEIGI